VEPDDAEAAQRIARRVGLGQRHLALLIRHCMELC
jgi:hypothetical protein